MTSLDFFLVSNINSFRIIYVSKSLYVKHKFQMSAKNWMFPKKLTEKLHFETKTVKINFSAKGFISHAQKNSMKHHKNPYKWFFSDNGFYREKNWTFYTHMVVLHIHYNIFWKSSPNWMYSHILLGFVWIKLSLFCGEMSLWTVRFQNDKKNSIQFLCKKTRIFSNANCNKMFFQLFWSQYFSFFLFCALNLILKYS